MKIVRAKRKRGRRRSRRRRKNNGLTDEKAKKIE